MSQGATLRELGEFGLIDRIAVRATAGAGVVTGIGDDAAVTSPAPDSLTLSTSDMLVEGVHFDLSWTDPLTLGRKSLSVNLSDIAAMGGEPRFFLLSLAIPPSLSVQFMDDLLRGMLERADQFGVSLIGGDTCSSRSGLVISITVMGEQLAERIVRRSGARPGDLVFVSGTVGDAALGLALLRGGERGDHRAIRRHLDPTPRVREGAALAATRLPTAMIDVSDGLAADLGHILRRSAVGARIDLSRLPLSPPLRGEGGLPSDDRLSLALAGGEDYELLFTAPADREGEATALFQRLGTRLTMIGRVTAEAGLSLVLPDGSEYAQGEKGYDHFA